MTDTPIRQAATLILLRDGAPGLEVLLLQRSTAVDFSPGAWVFPGGRVDAEDLLAAGQDTALAARLAAVRETEEEAALRLDADRLQLFSHWLTPAGANRRYDTGFFLAVLEEDVPVRVDGSEIVDHAWFTPASALEAHRQGQLSILPPTFVTLDVLRASASAAQALQACRERPVPRFEPRVLVCNEDICFLYEGDVAYETAQLDAPGPRHRFWMGQSSRYECDIF